MESIDLMLVNLRPSQFDLDDTLERSFSDESDQPARPRCFPEHPALKTIEACQATLLSQNKARRP